MDGSSSRPIYFGELTYHRHYNEARFLGEPSTKEKYEAWMKHSHQMLEIEDRPVGSKDLHQLPSLLPSLLMDSRSITPLDSSMYSHHSIDLPTISWDANLDFMYRATVDEVLPIVERFPVIQLLPIHDTVLVLDVLLVLTPISMSLLRPTPDGRFLCLYKQIREPKDIKKSGFNCRAVYDPKEQRIAVTTHNINSIHLYDIIIRLPDCDHLDRLEREVVPKLITSKDINVPVQAIFPTADKLNDDAMERIVRWPSIVERHADSSKILPYPLRIGISGQNLEDSGCLAAYVPSTSGATQGGGGYNYPPDSDDPSPTPFSPQSNSSGVGDAEVEVLKNEKVCSSLSLNEFALNKYLLGRYDGPYLKGWGSGMVAEERIRQIQLRANQDEWQNNLLRDLGSIRIASHETLSPKVFSQAMRQLTLDQALNKGFHNRYSFESIPISRLTSRGLTILPPLETIRQEVHNDSNPRKGDKIKSIHSFHMPPSSGEKTKVPIRPSLPHFKSSRCLFNVRGPLAVDPIVSIINSVKAMNSTSDHQPLTDHLTEQKKQLNKEPQLPCLNPSHFQHFALDLPDKSYREFSPVQLNFVKPVIFGTHIPPKVEGTSSKRPRSNRFHSSVYLSHLLRIVTSVSHPFLCFLELNEWKISKKLIMQSWGVQLEVHSGKPIGSTCSYSNLYDGEDAWQTLPVGALLFPRRIPDERRKLLASNNEISLVNFDQQIFDVNTLMRLNKIYPHKTAEEKPWRGPGFFHAVGIRFDNVILTLTENNEIIWIAWLQRLKETRVASLNLAAKEGTATAVTGGLYQPLPLAKCVANHVGFFKPAGGSTDNIAIVHTSGRILFVGSHAGLYDYGVPWIPLDEMPAYPATLNIPSGYLVRTPTSTGRVTVLEWSRDSRYLMVGSLDGPVIVASLCGVASSQFLPKTSNMTLYGGITAGSWNAIGNALLVAPTSRPFELISIRLVMPLPNLKSFLPTSNPFCIAWKGKRKGETGEVLLCSAWMRPSRNMGQDLYHVLNTHCGDEGMKLVRVGQEIYYAGQDELVKLDLPTLGPTFHFLSTTHGPQIAVNAKGSFMVAISPEKGLSFKFLRKNPSDISLPPAMTKLHENDPFKDYDGECELVARLETEFAADDSPDYDSPVSTPSNRRKRMSSAEAKSPAHCAIDEFFSARLIPVRRGPTVKEQIEVDRRLQHNLVIPDSEALGQPFSGSNPWEFITNISHTHFIPSDSALTSPAAATTLTRVSEEEDVTPSSDSPTNDSKSPALKPVKPGESKPPVPATIVRIETPLRPEPSPWCLMSLSTESNPPIERDHRDCDSMDIFVYVRKNVQVPDLEEEFVENQDEDIYVMTYQPQVDECSDEDLSAGSSSDSVKDANHKKQKPGLFGRIKRQLTSGFQPNSKTSMPILKQFKRNYESSGTDLIHRRSIFKNTVNEASYNLPAAQIFLNYGNMISTRTLRMEMYDACGSKILGPFLQPFARDLARHRWHHGVRSVPDAIYDLSIVGRPFWSSKEVGLLSTYHIEILHLMNETRGVTSSKREAVSSTGWCCRPLIIVPCDIPESHQWVPSDLSEDGEPSDCEGLIHELTKPISEPLVGIYDEKMNFTLLLIGKTQWLRSLHSDSAYCRRAQAPNLSFVAHCSFSGLGWNRHPSEIRCVGTSVVGDHGILELPMVLLVVFDTGTCGLVSILPSTSSGALAASFPSVQYNEFDLGKLRVHSVICERGAQLNRSIEAPVRMNSFSHGSLNGGQSESQVSDEHRYERLESIKVPINSNATGNHDWDSVGDRRSDVMNDFISYSSLCLDRFLNDNRRTAASSRGAKRASSQPPAMDARQHREGTSQHLDRLKDIQREYSEMMAAWGVTLDTIIWPEDVKVLSQHSSPEEVSIGGRNLFFTCNDGVLIWVSVTLTFVLATQRLGIRLRRSGDLHQSSMTLQNPNSILTDIDLKSGVAHYFKKSQPDETFDKHDYPSIDRVPVDNRNDYSDLLLKDWWSTVLKNERNAKYMSRSPIHENSKPLAYKIDPFPLIPAMLIAFHEPLGDDENVHELHLTAARLKRVLSVFINEGFDDDVIRNPQVKLFSLQWALYSSFEGKGALRAFMKADSHCQKVGDVDAELEECCNRFLRYSTKDDTIEDNARFLGFVPESVWQKLSHGFIEKHLSQSPVAKSRSLGMSSSSSEFTMARATRSTSRSYDQGFYSPIKFMSGESRPAMSNESLTAIMSQDDMINSAEPPDDEYPRLISAGEVKPLLYSLLRGNANHRRNMITFSRFLAIVMSSLGNNDIISMRLLTDVSRKVESLTTMFAMFPLAKIHPIAFMIDGLHKSELKRADHESLLNNIITVQYLTGPVPCRVLFCLPLLQLLLKSMEKEKSSTALLSHINLKGEMNAQPLRFDEPELQCVVIV
eukprot:GHVH01000331.1.p1 GENE.GHVH01000331.1~~GHVH01000331.1.p1  ORF type:complete len:2387 (+),score=331.37 GHVH01000331.1:51-7211(+)